MRRAAHSFIFFAVVTLLGGILPWGLPTAVAITPPVTPEQVSGDVNLLFSRGGSPARYTANSVVTVEAGNINFVRGCIPGPSGRGFPDFVQATADLYIVPSGRTFQNTNALSDALGSPNSVFAGLGGSFLWEPLALTGSAGSATGLPSGTYDVVVDECQNGMWDTGQDTVVRDAFRVDIDQVVPGFDYEVAQFEAMKTRAGERLGVTSQVESVLFQILLLEVSAEIEKVASVAGGFAGGTTSYVNILIGSIDPSAALKNWGKTYIMNSVQKRRLALINLRDDPPDPDFQQFASPVRTADTVSAPVPELVEVAALANANDAIAAIEEAFVRALERYQGAQEAGNVAWAARHARSLDELATLHAELTATLPALTQPIVDKYNRSGDTYAAQIDLRGVLNGGLSSFASGAGGLEGSTLWWNTGLSAEATEEAIDVFVEHVVDAPPTSVGVLERRLPELTASAVSDAEFSAEMRAWADSAVPGVLAELDAAISPIAVDPVVSITPVVGAAAGSTVTLGVDLPADYVADSIRWDLDGDGVFDDGSGASPEWRVPGNLRAGVPFVIAVEVAGGLTTDVAYDVVIPVEGNLPPTIEVVAPNPVEGSPGTTTTLQVATTDPEGDPVNVDWFVDGAATGATGDSFDVAVPVDFFGQIEVLAVATDAAGATAITVFPLSVRSGVDADGDGFFAFPGPDCDDAAFFVRPTSPEFTNDGVDNDCDPSTPDSGTPISQGIPAAPFFRAVEGSVYEFSLTNWNHPNRIGDQPFTVTVEWGDGTTSTQTVQGTTTAETNFLLTHRYTDEVAEGTLRWCVNNGTDPEGCLERVGSIDIDNEPPFVGAADMRTWSQDDASENPNQCNNPAACDGQTPTGNGADWIVDAEGRWATSTGNPSDYIVLHSPVDLAEAGYGRAMVELSVIQRGDNDNMGLVVGYDENDLLGLTGEEDFVDFEWTGRSRTRQTGENPTSPPSCRNPNAEDLAPQDDLVDTATISRTRGPAINHERNYNVVVDVVDPAGGPVNPLCQDEFGVDELFVIDFDDDDLANDGSSDRWLTRAIARNEVGSPKFGPLEQPYTFTVDYRPDRLRLWTANGSLVADVAPRDPSDPFPPGGLGVVYWSQGAVRAKGTAPELGYTFTQGSEGSISMPFTDGGDDEWVATVNWGDGSSQTLGTITADPATGPGWHLVDASHTYLRAGNYRGEVCVIDDLDEGSCFTFRVTVDNLAPVVEAGPDIVDAADVVSGATLVLDQATFTDPGARDDHTATIDWGDGSPVDVGVVGSTRSSGGTVSGTHTYAGDGVYQVEVCVSDQAGGTGCDTLDVDVRVANQPPVSGIDVPAEDDLINVEVLLGGSFTDANPDDTHTMTIDPGDGSGVQPLPLQVGTNPVVGSVGRGGIGHVYTVPGTYEVTTCVTDAGGETDCITAEFTALDDGTSNNPPTVDPGGPYSADEGATVTLDASASSDPEGDEVTIAWDADGDGTFETPGTTLSVVADDGPGSVSVDVEVCDSAGLCAVGTAVIQVDGVAPTVTAFDVTVDGTDATAAVTFTDPAAPDTHDVVIDWGDGSTPIEQASTAPNGATVTATHSYAPGTWIVTATVTDDDGDVGTQTAQVEVLRPNQAPVADAGGPYSLSEGSTVALDGSGSSDPDGEQVSLSWDVDGDGSFDDVPNVSGLDGPAALTVTVRACDLAGACDDDDATVSVDNVAPTVGEAAVAQDGGEVSVDIEFADPGSVDTHTVVVDWGDDSSPSEQTSTAPGGGTVSAVHVYETGTWQALVTVTDDDGGATTTTFEVVVDATPTGSPCDTLEPTITGTERRDVLRGTDGPDVIFGLGGNDVIFGFGGDDVLCGGPGNDWLYGSSGNDVIQGGDGNDRLFGWEGDDVLTGDSGNDRIYGSWGDDVLTGDDGNDRLFGWEGDDVLTGGDGNDLLDGGPGGADSGDGGDGTDTCSGVEAATNCERGRRHHVSGWSLRWYCDIDWILDRHR